MRRILVADLTSLLLVTAILTSVISAAQVADGSDYNLSWWTVDGGGGTFSSGGGYTLSSTAGQPDAATVQGGAYALSGGFWGGGAGPVEYNVHLPLVLRNYP